MGDGGGSGAVRAGAAFVELYANDERLVGALERARAKLTAFGGTFFKVGAAAAAAGGLIFAPLQGLLKGAVDNGRAMTFLAAQTGSTVENISALAYAFQRVGIEADEFAMIVKYLQHDLSAAADGNAAVIKQFARLGLNGRELFALNDPVKQLEALGQAIGEVANGADRAKLAVDYFGRSGTHSLKLFANGSVELKKYMAEAGRVGATVSAEQAAQAMKISESWAYVSGAIKYAFLEIGRALLPEADSIEKFGRQIADVARQVRTWIGENKELIQGAFIVSQVVLAAGAATATFGIGIGLISAAMVPLVSAGTALVAVVSSLLTPGGALAAVLAPLAIIPLAVGAAVGAMVGAFAGLIIFVPQAREIITGFFVSAYQWVQRNNPFKPLQDAALAAFEGIRRAAVWAWEGIRPVVQTVGAFILDQVLRPLWGAATRGWANVATEAAATWGVARDTAVQAWGGILSAIRAGDLSAAAGIAWAGLQVVFAQGSLSLKTLFEDLWEWLAGGWDLSVKTFRGLWSTAILSVQQLFVNMASSVLNRIADVADKLKQTSLASDLRGSAQLGENSLRLQRVADDAEAQKEADKAAEARKGKRDLNLAGARDVVDVAKKEFANLLAREAARAKADKGAAGALPGAGLPPILDQLGNKAKGVFDSSDSGFARALGVGDSVAQRQLRVAEQTRDGVNRVEQAVQKAAGALLIG